MIRTRFAPSPTGYMHIGNLRTALYEYLIAKSNNGSFILRIEDTDQERLVEGSTDVIYNTLKMSNIIHDEGPDIGGDYGPYIQSQRKNDYLEYAKELVKKGEAYYCFCTKERLEDLKNSATDSNIVKYDRHCLNLTDDEVQENLKNNIPYVIRQKIKAGSTTFHDEVYGSITVENAEMEDQILIKADGFPTYNFANVIDDHNMNITHVVRGAEYLSSTPKYNLLYDAFDWQIPIYVHLPAVMKDERNKLSKRNGDASFQDLIDKGYLPEAIVNYIALLGWSPSINQEIFTMDELISEFNIKGISKSPSIFDINKLAWMNSEYIKKMNFDKFYSWAEPELKASISRNDIDLKKVASYIQSRISTLKDIPKLVSFIDNLPDYSTELYIHKKMKTTEEICLNNLKVVLPIIKDIQTWDNSTIYDTIVELIKEMGIKNGQMLWPIRTALSGEPSSPCGASELAELLGKEDTINRIERGIELLSN